MTETFFVTTYRRVTGFAADVLSISCKDWTWAAVRGIMYLVLVQAVAAKKTEQRFYRSLYTHVRTLMPTRIQGRRVLIAIQDLEIRRKRAKLPKRQRNGEKCPIFSLSVETDT